MQKQELVEAIYGYLINEAGVSTELSEDLSLVEGGVIDSFDIVALSTWLQTEYNLKIGPLDMTLENFDTVNRIAEFTLKKMG